MNSIMPMSVCTMIASVGALLLMLFGFYSIFKSAGMYENDLQVIQRQIRGFAIVIVSNFAFIAAVALCTFFNR